MAGIFRTLLRHSFDRFFDRESLSPQGDPQASLAQLLGLLAVPGAFFVLLLRSLTLRGWDLVFFRYFFVSFSMIVMAFIVVYSWDALFPDRRDYQILGAMPIRLWQLFLAKMLALAALLAVFLVDVNFFTVLFWPAIDGKPDVLAIFGAHAAALVTSGLFAALSMAAIQGVLVTFLSGGTLRRVSVLLQTLLMAGLVMAFFLTAFLAFRIRGLAEANSRLLDAFPPYWFIGFYEWLRPATRNAHLAALGVTALEGLAAAALLFLLTFLPGYRRHARRVLEAPEPDPTGPGFLRRRLSRLLDRWLLRRPVERAVYHFIGQTITRSMKHRLFLATYGGFGAPLSVLNLTASDDGLEIPLTLSFILVSGLRAAFNFPSELAANWTFRTSESCDAVEALAAMRKWIVVCAILPLFLVLAPFEFWRFPAPAALFHLGYGIALSLVLMDILFLGFRKVPFTCSYFPGKVNLVGLSVIYVFGFTAYSGRMAEVEGWLGRRPLAAVAFLVLVGAARVLLARLRGRRTLDYEDTVDPEVRTLGLSTR